PAERHRLRRRTPTRDLPRRRSARGRRGYAHPPRPARCGCRHRTHRARPPRGVPRPRLARRDSRESGPHRPGRRTRRRRASTRITNPRRETPPRTRRPRRGRRTPRAVAVNEGLSVRARILAVVILVAALGMAVAGGAANLAQREFARGHVDDRLLASAAAVDSLVKGEAFDDPDIDTTPPETSVPDFASTSEALQYAISRIVPDSNEATVGILDGDARWVPATRLEFHLEADPEF